MSFLFLVIARVAIMKKFGLTGGQEGEFSTIKEITYVQWSCKSHDPKQSS